MSNTNSLYVGVYIWKSIPVVDVTIEGIFFKSENLNFPSFVINSLSFSTTDKYLFLEVLITISWLSIFKFREKLEMKPPLLKACLQKQQ